MKHLCFVIFYMTFFILIGTNTTVASETTLNYGRFGKATLYQQSLRPSHVVLFVSGDGGWNLGVVDMARELSTLDALVVGIDITHYIKEMETSSGKCSYPAADFEMLSKFVQKQLEFPAYIPPVLIGYSSGATLVYAVLAQSPPNTFNGAISLGFCPDLLLSKPMCRGNGLEWKEGPRGKGYSFLPAQNLSSPWIAFQGEIDQVCDPKDTEAYVKQVKNGELVMLPKVGHGFSVPRNWMPQFRKAFTSLAERKARLQLPEDAAVKDLPLVELRTKSETTQTMAVIISGDGGWASLDRELGEFLADRGIPVVGLNSLQYFWTHRTPESASKDLERILAHYLTAWNKDKAVIIGYSLGADVLPFMLNRVSPELFQHIQAAVLLGPGHEVDFEFHLSDWLGTASTKTSLPTFPETEKLGDKKIKILCFMGEDEKNSLCNDLKKGDVRVIPLKGGHHFGGNYRGLAEIILKETE